MTPVSGGVGLPFAPGPTPQTPEAPELPYFVTFYERDQPRSRYTVRLGDTPPTPGVAGGGGTAGDWNIVTLPKRCAVTIWEGRAGLILMTVPIVIGEYGAAPLNPSRSTLNAMWRPSDATDEPPVVKVRGPGSAIPYQDLDYVITDIAWGDAAGGPEGNRLLQHQTVTLLEYRPDETLQTERAKRPKHRGRSYTVKHGDTLSGIARRFRVKGGWQKLAAAQHPPIRDPRSLKVGRVLLIP